MPIKPAVIPVTPFHQNCSLLICDATGSAAIVDPGGDLDRVLRTVERYTVKLEKILLTQRRSNRHVRDAALAH